MSFSTFPLQAEERTYSVYRLREAPLLDGRVRDDPAWKNIPEEGAFVLSHSNTLSSKQTFFRIGSYSEALYIGIVCEEPEMHRIKAELKDMEMLWNEDSVEIFLFPKGRDGYLQFIINAIGSRLSYEFVGLLQQQGPEVPLTNWQAKTYKGENYWSVEIKMPWELFLTIPEKGVEWRGNICRNILTAEDRFSTWAQGGVHQPSDKLGRILFVNEFSTEETARKAEDRLINIFRKKIVTKLKSSLEFKEEVVKRIEEFPSFKKEITSFLKNYEEIDKELAQLNTVEKVNLLFMRSKNLFKEADKLKRRILLEDIWKSL